MMSPIDFVDLGSPAGWKGLPQISQMTQILSQRLLGSRLIAKERSPTDFTDDTDFEPTALGEQIDCERKSPTDFTDDTDFEPTALGESIERERKSPTDFTDDTDLACGFGEQIDCERKICEICEICGRIKIVGNYE